MAASTRARLAIILLLAVSLVILDQLLMQTRALSLQHKQPDEVTAYIHRFDRIKSVLPKYGTVCYTPGPQTGDKAKRDYFLARYALAPLVLRVAAECDPLIGDFPGCAGPACFDKTQFNELQDYGDGVLLLRRISK